MEGILDLISPDGTLDLVRLEVGGQTASPGPGSHFISSHLPIGTFPFLPRVASKVFEIQDMVEIPGSGNLISLLPPDGILERSPAGPEKEEILGLLITAMMMWMRMTL